MATPSVRRSGRARWRARRARRPQRRWFDDALAALRATGLAEHEKASTVLLVSGYVRNVATLEASLAAGYAAAGATPDEAMQAWTHLVARLNADGRFPAVAEVLRAGVFDRADDPDDEFVFGLERVLDGVEVLVREGARVRRPG